MEYKDSIIKSIEYIENNLHEKLTGKSCSKAAGYSEYHFIKIFKGVVGYTPMEYIRKRRLSIAAAMLMETDKSIFDIAFQTGHNSQENFIRAFKSEHGITPNSYRKTRNSIHLIEAYSSNPFHELEISVNPTIKEIHEKRIYCHVFETDETNRHHDIPRFWNLYHKHKMYLEFDDTQNQDDRIDYGWLEHASNGRFNYWIGCEGCVDKGDSQHRVLTIPAGRYAVFSTPKADAFTFVEVIHKTWDYIYNVWMNENNINKQNEYAFECYCENSRSYSEDIYIQIK